MALFLLRKPTASEANINIETELSGRSYVLSFDWNGRTNLWTFGLSDESGVLLAGRAVRHGLPLTLGVRKPTMPPGILLVSTADGSDPTLETFADADLIYAESAGDLIDG